MSGECPLPRALGVVAFVSIVVAARRALRKRSKGGEMGGGVAPLPPRASEHFGRSEYLIPKELTEGGGADGFLAARLQVAVDLAAEAGQAIKLVLDSNSKTVNTKKGLAVDLVTETDQNNEKLIFEGLRSAFPTDKFIGEEDSAAKGHIEPLTDDPTWICDPVDGTTNFVHGFPLTCVSIGFTVGKECRLGVVFDPCSKEMFITMKGKGAWVNGRRVSASTCSELQSALVIHEFGYARDDASLDCMLAATGAVLKKSRGLRQLGSGAIDLCWVGCGRVDGLYSGVAGEGWQPWDYAAGWLFILEAGGVVRQCDGQAFDMWGKWGICCGGQETVVGEIVDVIAPHLRQD